MILITLPFYVGYGLRAAQLLGHPEIEPYFSRPWLVVMRSLWSPGFGASMA